MKPIIEIRNIYKKYQIGSIQPYYTLRDTLVGIIKSPFTLISRPEIKENGLAEDEFWALKNVSFNVIQGEVTGIIGRNGAGKSTLLKILSRITPPTKGKIYLRGRVASLLEIGTGFQQELTGRENIFLNGAILGMKQSEIKKKFDEIVAFSEIEKFLDTPVKHYSSGMYMRLAFSIAAHLDPEILMVDEVLAVGDSAFQKKCLGKMDSVVKEGRTVLFVSHNMGAIRNLCKKTLVLDRGKVITDSVTEKSLNIYNRLLREVKVDAQAGVSDQKLRRGSGAIRFTHFEIQDIYGKKKFAFEMGETIRFMMSYKLYSDLKGLAIYIALRSGTTREIVTSVRHIISAEKMSKGTKGSIIVKMPDVCIRPGEYPLYLHLGEIYGKATNFDALDDFTAPLVITSAKKDRYSNFDSSKPVGYFSLPSEIISSKISENKNNFR